MNLQPTAKRLAGTQKGDPLMSFWDQLPIVVRELNTGFLQTLETYLLCNKSLNDAANLLFIHKSTIYYRMKCIEKIVQIDLDDPHERFSILLSCIALREMSKFKNADRKTPRRDAHPASDAGAP